MADEDIEQARKIISGLDIFAGTDAAIIPVSRLGGLTNLVFSG